jgi:DNA-binding transcriptional MerR regulator
MKSAILTADVARRLGIGTRRVQQLADSGVLTFIRTPGGIRLYDPDQVERVRDARERQRQHADAIEVRR